MKDLLRFAGTLIGALILVVGLLLVVDAAMPEKPSYSDYESVVGQIVEDPTYPDPNSTVGIASVRIKFADLKEEHVWEHVIVSRSDALKAGETVTLEKFLHRVHNYHEEMFMSARRKE